MANELGVQENITVVGSASDAIAWSGLSLRVLNPSERQRLQRFRHRQAATEFLAGHLVARTLVSLITGMHSAQVSLVQGCSTCGGPHGPVHVESDEVFVSISHTHGFIAVTAAKEEMIGIDVERYEHNKLSPSAQNLAFHADELQMIAKGPNSQARAISLWTQKEAMIKAGLAPEGPTNGWSTYEYMARASAWGQRNVWLKNKGENYALCLISEKGSADSAGYMISIPKAGAVLNQAWPPLNTEWDTRIHAGARTASTAGHSRALVGRTSSHHG